MLKNESFSILGFDDKTLERLQKDFENKMIKIKGNYDRCPDWLYCSRQMVPDFVVKDPKESPVWEVTGAEFSKAELHTAAGISIRFPRVTKMRDDKDWKSATSLDQLKQLFETSKETTDALEDDDEDEKSRKRKAESDSETGPEDSKNLKVESPILKEEKKTGKRKGSSDIQTENESPIKDSKRQKLELSPKKDPSLKNGRNDANDRDVKSGVKSHTYDKRHLVTEHGFELEVLSSKENESLKKPHKNMIRFVSSTDNDLGDITEISDGKFKMVVKRKSVDDATYEALRIGFTSLKSNFHKGDVLSVLIDTKDEASSIRGLSINAIRTLVKNVFYHSTGVKIVFICPGLSEKKSRSEESSPKKSSNDNDFPFLKVYEEKKLTKIVKNGK